MFAASVAARPTPTAGGRPAPLGRRLHRPRAARDARRPSSSVRRRAVGDRSQPAAGRAAITRTPWLVSAADRRLQLGSLLPVANLTLPRAAARAVQAVSQGRQHPAYIFACATVRAVLTPLMPTFALLPWRSPMFDGVERRPASPNGDAPRPRSRSCSPCSAMGSWRPATCRRWRRHRGGSWPVATFFMFRAIKPYREEINAWRWGVDFVRHFGMASLKMGEWTLPPRRSRARRSARTLDVRKLQASTAT